MTLLISFSFTADQSGQPVLALRRCDLLVFIPDPWPCGRSSRIWEKFSQTARAVRVIPVAFIADYSINIRLYGVFDLSNGDLALSGHAPFFAYARVGIGTKGKPTHNYCMQSAFQFPQGFRLLPEYFTRTQQENLLHNVRAGMSIAPLYRPVMPRTGQPLSVRMSNFGPLGWVPGKDGYRYSTRHPVTDEPWPKLPQCLYTLWEKVSGWPNPPEACLINFYDNKARLGLHVDADEHVTNAPIVSVSLGDQALYRLGGPMRRDPTRSLRLSSGDVVVLAGASRQCYHGVDRIYPGTSTLLPKGGRINLTMRVVGQRNET